MNHRNSPLERRSVHGTGNANIHIVGYHQNGYFLDGRGLQPILLVV
jgi:hypothetical protein